MLTWIIQLTVGIASLLLARILVRHAWRRVGINPFCGRCGYDLRGRPDDAPCCAECGADLKARRAIRLGVPVRDARRGSIAILFVFVGVYCLWNGAKGARHQDWQPYKPFAWLRHDLESAELPRRLAAETELQRRLNKLTPQQLTSIVEARYAVRAGPPGINNISILVAAKLRRGQKLDDARWNSLCRNLVNVGMSTRPTVRHGDPIAFRTSAIITAKVSDLRMFVTVDVDDASVDQIPLLPDMDGLHVPQLSDARDCCGVLSDEQWKNLAPGLHRIDSTAVVQLRFGTYGETVVSDMIIPVSTTFSVVLPQTAQAFAGSAVTFAAPLSLYKALTPHSVGWGWIKVRLGDNQSILPNDVAFNVFVRQGVMEHPVGSFYALRNTPSPFSFNTPAIPLADKSFDIVLRPSPRVAARSMNIGDYWSQDIVFENVTRQPSMGAR